MLSSPIPADRESRWALVAHLIEVWFGGASRPPKDGLDESEIVAAEKRLGFRLPMALREWYLRFGGRHDVWDVQDWLVRPERLEVKEGRLPIYYECQLVVSWAIELAEIETEDPPVYLSDEDVANVWHLEANSISEFAVQM